MFCSEPSASACSSFGVPQYQLIDGQRKAQHTASTTRRIKKRARLFILISPDYLFSSDVFSASAVLSSEDFFTSFLSLSFADLSSAGVSFSTPEIAERLNSILVLSSTLTMTVLSLREETTPWIPPIVTTLSPFLSALSIFSVSFCFLFCGRIRKK